MAVDAGGFEDGADVTVVGQVAFGGRALVGGDVAAEGRRVRLALAGKKEQS
jgi:hypothetical protein